MLASTNLYGAPTQPCCYKAFPQTYGIDRSKL